MRPSALSKHGMLVSCATILLGCGDLTGAATPDIVQTGQLNTPAGALVQRAGAIADFALAFSGQALYSGLITDELIDAAGGIRAADRRMLVTTPFFNYPYDFLSQARIQSLRAVGALHQYAPTPGWHIGELFAYQGFVETYFVENMCAGIPLGVVTGGTPALGPTLDRSALEQRALADFDSAITYAGTEDSIAALALVGKARVLLDSGDFAQAARVAAHVPPGFQFFAQYAVTSGQANQLYVTIVAGLEASVSDDEGENGLNFVSAADPRVVTQDLGPGIFGTPDILAPVSQMQQTAPIVAASSIEARLIEAEAALPIHGGVGQGGLDTLNALRTSMPGLAPLSDPGTDSGRVSLLFRERAFWLFLTGHRQGDMRRLIRQYGRPTESVFPTGPYYQFGSYGTAIEFEPFGETYNPNFHGCLNDHP
jgi:starch-binding outer membrane protein, SusD/RagB family